MKISKDGVQVSEKAYRVFDEANRAAYYFSMGYMGAYFLVKLFRIFTNNNFDHKLDMYGIPADAYDSMNGRQRFNVMRGKNNV